MTQPPEQHHEDPDVPCPLFQPLSEAEIAKRRRMREKSRAMTPRQTGFEFMMIMIREGLIYGP